MPTHDSPGLVQTPGRKLRSVNSPTSSPVLSAVGQGELLSAAGVSPSPRSPGDSCCASPGYVRFVDKRAPDKLLNTAGAPVGPGTPAQSTCYALGYSRSGGGLTLTRHLADDSPRAGAKRRAGAAGPDEAASNVETTVLFIQDTTGSARLREAAKKSADGQNNLDKIMQRMAQLEDTVERRKMEAKKDKEELTQELAKQKRHAKQAYEEMAKQRIEAKQELTQELAKQEMKFNKELTQKLAKQKEQVAHQHEKCSASQSWWWSKVAYEAKIAELSRETIWSRTRIAELEGNAAVLEERIAELQRSAAVLEERVAELSRETIWSRTRIAELEGNAAVHEKRITELTSQVQDFQDKHMDLWKPFCS
eukprot:jgi/Tetstr1/425268/TSEL_015721.t1